MQERNPGGALPATVPSSGEDMAYRFLIMSVGAEEYGIDILMVREIRGWTPERHLPTLPASMRGVINLRGVIVPITDLRARFGGAKTEATNRHVVVVVQIGDGLHGILADGISDILTVEAGSVHPIPEIHGGLVDSRYLKGLHADGARMVALLDVSALFSATELASLPLIGAEEGLGMRIASSGVQNHADQ